MPVAPLIEPHVLAAEVAALPDRSGSRVGTPVQVPVVAVSVWPGRASPVTAGNPVFVGVQAVASLAMLTVVVVLARVALATLLSTNLNEIVPSTSGQSSNWTRTAFIVSPGSKMSVPLAET